MFLFLLWFILVCLAARVGIFLGSGVMACLGGRKMFCLWERGGPWSCHGCSVRRCCRLGRVPFYFYVWGILRGRGAFRVMSRSGSSCCYFSCVFLVRFYFLWGFNVTGGLQLRPRMCSSLLWASNCLVVSWRTVFRGRLGLGSTCGGCVAWAFLRSLLLESRGDRDPYLL